MVTISMTGDSATEGSNGYVDFAVELNQASTFPVTVNYRMLYDSPLFSDTYRFATGSANNGTLTFAPGETAKTVSVRLWNAGGDEVDEHFTLELYDPSGATFVGDAPVLRANGIILDADGAGSNLALFVSDPVITEGDSGSDTATFEIELSRTAPEAMSFSYTTIDGTAVAGQDYTATEGTLDFAPGQRTAEITVPVLGDTEGEPAEWFSLALEPTTATPVDLTDAVGVAEIRDTDAGALPVISIEGDGVAENSGEYARFTVSLSEPFLDTARVDYRMLYDTPLFGDTYRGAAANANNGTITFAPGQTSADVLVRMWTGGGDERDENFTLELFNPVNASFGEGLPVLRANATIRDSEGDATLNRSVFVADPVLVEGDDGQRLAQFEVVLSRPAESPFVFRYETIDGTALAGSDYAAAEGQIEFRPGQDRAVVSVPVFGDAEAEPTEWFSLKLEPVTTAPMGLTDAVGTAEILDTDSSASLPEIALFGDAVEENSGEYLRFVVSLSETPLDAVTVAYRLLGDSAQGGDTYRSPTSDANTGTVTFAPGETSASVLVRLWTGGGDEVDENVTLELYDPAGAVFPDDAPVLRANGTIRDVDGPGSNLAVFVSDPVVTEGDSGTRLATFDLVLSRPAETPISFAYETADGSAKIGADFTAVPGFVEFAVGQERASVSVPVIGDTAPEAAETFSLVLEPITALPIGLADSVGEATILDTDTSPLPEISITGDRVFEGDDARFLVTLSEPSAQTVTVQYATGLGTLSDTELREVSDTLTFAPGETSKRVLVDTFGDSVEERDESFHLRLSAPENAVFAQGQTAISASALVLDDDSVGFTRGVYIVPTDVAEDTLETKRVAIPVELSSPSGAPVSFDVGVVAGTAEPGIDYTLLTDEITFEPFQTRAFIEIDVLPDTVVEETEGFELSLTKTDDTVFFGVIPTAPVSITNASPDLLIPSFQIGPTSAGDGETVSGTLTVENAGTATVLGGEIGYYLSDNATLSTEDTRIGTLTLADPLAAGESRQLDISVTLPEGVATGTYFLGAIADPDDALAELAEDNNVALPEGIFVNGVSPDPVQTLTGDNGPEALTGLSNDDTLLGLGGNDTLTGAGGDDVLDGGRGFDVAVYSGQQSAYTVTISPEGVEISDRRGGGDGTDTLRGIEALQFPGEAPGETESWPIDSFTDVVQLSEADFRTFVEMYIAYFNRAPDAEGLMFWGTALSRGTPLDDIAALFFDQDETRGLYPGVADLENPSTAQLEAFAGDVYQNVLGRSFDQAGLDFWVGVLENGSVSLGEFMLRIIEGAKAPADENDDPDFIAQKAEDVAYLTQKTDLGIYFSVVKGMSDVADARAVMADYDGSPGSVADARAEIDTVHSAALDATDGEFLLSLVGVVDDPFLA